MDHYIIWLWAEYGMHPIIFLLTVSTLVFMLLLMILSKRVKHH